MSEGAFRILCLVLVIVGLCLYIAAAVVFLTGGSGLRSIFLIIWGSGCISIVTRYIWRRNHRG